jgi:hypothetical protein
MDNDNRRIFQLLPRCRILELLDDAGPLDEGRHTESALPGRSLLAVEGDGAVVEPGEGLSAVVGGVEDDMLSHAQFKGPFVVMGSKFRFD